MVPPYLSKAGCGAIKKDGAVHHPFVLSHLSCFLPNDVNFSALETDCSVGGGKQCVVPAHTDIKAREEFCSTLPDDN